MTEVTKMEKKIKATEAPEIDWKEEAGRLEAAINAIPLAIENEKELSPEIQAFKVRLQQLLFGNLIKFPKNIKLPPWAQTA